MKKSVKVGLLSAFVYPGLGHLILKKKAIAFTLAGVFSIALYIVVGDMITRINIVLEQVLSGKIPLDVAAITEVLEKHPTQVSGLIPMLLLIVWLIGIVDSYRVGCKEISKS